MAGKRGKGAAGAANWGSECQSPAPEARCDLMAQPGTISLAAARLAGLGGTLEGLSSAFKRSACPPPPARAADEEVMHVGRRVYVSNLAWRTSWQDLKDKCVGRRRGLTERARALPGSQGRAAGARRR